MAEMPVHRLRQPVTGTPSPERERLAEMIAANTAADNQRAAVVAAHQRAELAVFEARRSLETAEAAVAQSKVDAGTFLSDVVRGDVGARPTTIREARRSLQDAADELESVVAARDSLAVQVADADRYPGLARDKLRSAARAVIAAEGIERAQAVVAEVAELRRDLASKLTEIEWLWLADVLPKNAFGQPSDSAVAAGLMMLQSSAWADQAAALAVGRARWRDVLDRLMVDAGAPLP
jgi:hypothetical protein